MAAAFIASAGPLRRSTATCPGLSCCCSPAIESTLQTSVISRGSVSSSQFSVRNHAHSRISVCKLFTSSSAGFWHISQDRSNRRSGLLKIVGRAGGSRPPPGARRPRPQSARPQPSDDQTRDGLPVNEEILSDIVMLLGEDGKLVGRMSRNEALVRASEMGLDLVQLDKQDPPCVKIADYSKLKYELQKRKKEQQKKSVANRMDLKELKMRYNIDVHDYGVRLKSAQKFLKDGDKVKLIIQFKGRELEFKDLGLKLFERFEEDVGEEGIVESKITKDSRSISMVLAPRRTKSSSQSSSTDKPNPEELSEDPSSVAAASAKA